jgi:hypothetical protein
VTSSHVERRIKARYVEDGRVLLIYEYVDLCWDERDPFAVSCGRLTFGRDLFDDVLRSGGSAGEGVIKLCLQVPPGCYTPFLLLTGPWDDEVTGEGGEATYALNPKPVAEFTSETYRRVPRDSESEFVDFTSELAGVLPGAA